MGPKITHRRDPVGSFSVLRVCRVSHRFAVEASAITAIADALCAWIFRDPRVTRAIQKEIP
jgi:hypothetical protein